MSSKEAKFACSAHMFTDWVKKSEVKSGVTTDL